MRLTTHYSLQLAAICLATVLLAPGTARAQDPDLVISDLQLVSSKRINRTVYEYVYRAVARNRGGAAEAVQATLESWPVQLSVIDGEASFGALAAGQSLPSADTVTLRHDRSRGGFTAQGLTWRFSYLQQEPGLLSGAPDLPAVQATTDLRIVGVNPDAPVETDASGTQYLRTVLVVTLDPDATVGQINAALTRHGARINVMMTGVRVLSVTVPDPGSLPALRALADALRAEPGIEAVYLSDRPAPKSLPPNPVYQQDLPAHIEKIDHHLAIRGAAVWNLTGLLDKPELKDRRPMLVVSDFFGRGWPAGGPQPSLPPEGWSVLLPSSDIRNPSQGNQGKDHGYGVLSVIAADHDVGFERDFDRLTGLYPAPLRTRVADLEIQDADSITTTASVLREAVGTGANVILNTSLGVCSPPDCDAEERLRAHHRGQLWLDEVRGVSAGANIENRFLHLTAAGNENAAMAWQTSGFNFVSRGLQLPPQEELELLNFDVDTITKVDENGDPVLDFFFQPVKLPRLDNVLSVENRYNKLAGTQVDASAGRMLPPLVGCLSPTSTRGGHIAGIGGASYQVSGGSTVDSKIWLASGPDYSYGTNQATGTSFATPQVAAAAAWVWSLRPDLTALQVKDLLLRTTMHKATVCDPYAQQLEDEPGAHKTVDVYAAALATDNPFYDDPVRSRNLGASAVAPARLWLLDVASPRPDGSLSNQPDGLFTQADLLKFLQEFESRKGATDYSRYDLNGNGATGERYARTDIIDIARFDLDGDLDWTTAVQTMEGHSVPVDEYQVADIGVLIFYAYSPLYTGNEYERALLLAPYLEKFNNKTLFLEGLDIQAGSPARTIRLTSLQKQGDGMAFVSNCATGERGDPLFSAEVYNRSAETQIAPIFWQGLMSNRISDEPPNAPSCSSFVATVPSTGQWWINVAARNRKDTAPVHDNEYQMRVYLGEPDLLAGPSGNLNPPPGRVASQHITYGSVLSNTLDPQGWTLPYTPSPGFPGAFQIKSITFTPSL